MQRHRRYICRTSHKENIASDYKIKLSHHRVAKREIAMLLFVFQLTFCLVHCQILEWNGTEIRNNSVIYYEDILNGTFALKCITENSHCCSHSTGNWVTQTGEIAHQGADGAQCLYFERYLVISLHRLRACIIPLTGLWRCDIPDSSGEIQSLFIFIATSPSSG